MPDAPPVYDPAVTLSAAIAELGRGVLDLLLPAVCAACRRTMGDARRGIVCGLCWGRIAPLPSPRCERCGHPGRGHACRWCELLPPYVRAVRSACWAHAGTGRAIVHALKYGRWTAAADGMAERMARERWPDDVVEERTALVPVPLASARLRERGFNQAALLAAGLGRRWGVPVWDDVLVRARGASSQTRLTPDDRLRNVSGAFRAAVPAGRLRGSHLVVVDDVVTTAATLNACATALYSAGARIISYVTFARAPAAGDRT